MDYFSFISEFDIVQVLSLVVALLSFAFSVFIYVKNKKKKALAYYIPNSYYLIHDIENLDEYFVIAYKKEKISNLRYFQVQIGNGGNLPIFANDYESEVTLKFNEESRILNFELDDKALHPSDLNPIINKNANKLSIKPILLNENDYFTLNILVNNFKSFEGIKGRIIGINEINPVKGNWKQFIGLTILGVSVLTFAIFSIKATGEYETIQREIKEQPSYTVWCFYVALGFFLLGLMSFFPRGFRRGIIGFFSFVKAKYDSPEPPHHYLRP